MRKTALFSEHLMTRFYLHCKCTLLKRKAPSWDYNFCMSRSYSLTFSTLQISCLFQLKDKRMFVPYHEKGTAAIHLVLDDLLAVINLMTDECAVLCDLISH